MSVPGEGEVVGVEAVQKIGGEVGYRGHRHHGKRSRAGGYGGNVTGRGRGHVKGLADRPLVAVAQVQPQRTAAGAVARQTIGWSVLGGMLAATALGVFVIPVLFILIIKLSYGRKKLAELQEQYKPDEVINPEFLEE